MNRLHRPATALFGLAVFTATGPASAEILWRGDFETADLSQFNEVTGPVEQRVTFVEDPVREGTYAARVEIRPGDLGNGDLNRVEMGYHPPTEGFEGSERWYAFSAMQDADAPLGASWHAFAYFEAEVLYTGTLVFGLYPGNELRFDTRVGDDATQYSTYFEPGVWHDFVLHVVWSDDPAIGLVELWYDGEQVVAPLPVATMHTMPDGTAAPNFLHVGMIRDENLAETEVFYYDGVLEATEAQDVMGGGGDTTGGGSDSTGGGDGTTANESVTAASDPSDATDPTDPSNASDPTETAGDNTQDSAASGESSSSAAQGGADGGGCGCTDVRAAGTGERALAVLAVCIAWPRRRRRATPV